MKKILCLLLIVSSCSFKKSQLENQTLKGHEELYSEPSAPKISSLDPDEKRIVIASTNDIHGNFNPELVKFKDDHQKNGQETKIGGLDVIQSYFKILRGKYPHLVLVDSGNIFSDEESMNDTRKTYSLLQYDGITVGLRDFNLKVSGQTGTSSDFFQKFSKNSDVPLILSNLYDLKTARGVEWPGTKPYVIKETNGVKVGIIGLIPNDIVEQTPVNNRVGLFVEDMLQSTLKQARLVRSLGADVVVVITHQGIDCSTELSEETKLPPMKVNFEPQRENICDLTSPMGDFLKKLPPKLVDVVIGGRVPQKMVNFVNGTLVMSSFPDGKSFNYAEFIVDTKTKKIVPEKTVVHQPVIFCHEFFKETNDCFTEDATINHKARVPATFLGKTIEQNNATAFSRSELLEVRNISKNLTTFNADLSYVPRSSGKTQLVVLSMTGKELLKILEEDYNHNHKNHWQPSPFLIKDNNLTISISGLDLDLNKVYRILTDLESSQKNRMLSKKVGSYDSEGLMNNSWLSIEEDTISIRTAAPTR
jgi:2',3'-cyclic-nucleotide 2'-phosphodiesterase (5'-nucleotidase family)